MPALLNEPFPIVLAPTGMVPTRKDSPHVPLTPAEVARDVAAAAAIGLTSVHVHARDEEGNPDWRRSTYERFVGAIKEAAPDVLINVSTSGRSWSELERRADCLALSDDLKPDLAKKIVGCFLAFRFPESMVKEFNGDDRFVPITYKETWKVVRDIAEGSGTPYNKSAYDTEAKREAAELAKKQQPKP